MLLSTLAFLSALSVSSGATAVDSVPLYDNLGDHHYAITTASPIAQRYFDQGLRLYYAFNHSESIRAFREAQRLDPSCAMCFWGEALARGPNINLPMDSAASVAAFAAARRAQDAVGTDTSLRERTLIHALSVRYASTPPADRASLDSAYATAMRSAMQQFPDDQDIAVLYAESAMDLRPWNYWTSHGTLQPGMEHAIKQLERVMRVNPRHPGACHFFIHAVEAVQPERAVECAERLAALMPGAGHLVHMPGHIYIRVGRYADAITANEHAVHADETYIRDQNPELGMYTAGYYPHNYDFLAFAAAMAGRREQSIDAADKLAQLAPVELLRAPGMTFLQHHGTRRLQMRVRFSAWQEILDTPAPDSALRHATAMWHYARGRALVATGKLAEATQSLSQVRAAVDDPSLQGVRLEFNEAPAVLRVAVQVLNGMLASAEGRHDDAVAYLSNAVEFEDALTYGEPPEWSIPTRQDLGAVLLAANRAKEAGRAYRSDLKRFPNNGWSLKGLEQSLRAQGKHGEADRMKAAAAKAFAQ